MQAMILERPGAPLVLHTRSEPAPGPGEVRLRVLACGVCRTDLHIADGDLPLPRQPIVPGHEVVGVVEALGPGVDCLALGQRVGVPWLGQSCGRCHYCTGGRENLCDLPQFTGYHRDGGFATHVLADARFCLSLDGYTQEPQKLAPLLCAGLIGWRCLRAAGDAMRLGLYGFGAAGHLVSQVASRQGRRVFAFTRPGDLAGQDHARRRGAIWAGGSDGLPPEPLDAAILFAPAGELVPRALAAVCKGGRVVCGGIHMSDIPSFPYRLLWQERQLVSVANLTRLDGREFLEQVRGMDLQVDTTEFALPNANEALAALRSGALQGAAVLLP